MSRRRASWRPYEGPSDEQLEVIRYGRVQAVPMSADADDDDLIGTPQWWLALAIFASLGAALLPALAACIWAVCYVGGLVR